MVEPVLLAKFDVFELLLKLAKHNHARCFPGFLWLFHKHLRTKVHKFRRAKILVGVEKLLSGFVRFPILVVPVNIPRWIAGVCVLSKVIWRVGNNQLRLWYAINLEILKMVLNNSTLFIILFSNF